VVGQTEARQLTKAAIPRCYVIGKVPAANVGSRILCDVLAAGCKMIDASGCGSFEALIEGAKYKLWDKGSRFVSGDRR